MSLKAIVHSSELLTGEGIRRKDGRRIREEDLGRIEDGALVYRTRQRGGVEIPDRVVWVGKSEELPGKFARVPRKDLRGRRALIPGLVDCHTHLIFAGDRSDEFAARCGGATYEQIAAGGGGILASVRATRQASAGDLERQASRRLAEAWRFGTRTIEIKSGYGLSTEAELKILRVIPRLRKRFPAMTITATFLGAHAFPPDQSRGEYLQALLDEMLPRVARDKLADSCDVFIDEGYYTPLEGERILRRARELGLATKAHADELVNTESAALAARLGALSADHLLKVSERGIAALAASETVSVLLPGTAFYLKSTHAPARRLLDAGARVAISTDFNPGTCMTLNLPAVMTIAALYLGMTRAELFAAVTFNAARALGLSERKGTLEPGTDADFTILPFARFEEMYYRFGWPPSGYPR